MDARSGDANLYRYVRNNPVNRVDYFGRNDNLLDDFLDDPTDVDLRLDELREGGEGNFQRKATGVWQVETPEPEIGTAPAENRSSGKRRLDRTEASRYRENRR